MHVIASALGCQISYTSNATGTGPIISSYLEFDGDVITVEQQNTAGQGASTVKDRPVGGDGRLGCGRNADRGLGYRHRGGWIRHVDVDRTVKMGRHL